MAQLIRRNIDEFNSINLNVTYNRIKLRPSSTLKLNTFKTVQSFMSKVGGLLKFIWEHFKVSGVSIPTDF